MKVERPLPLGPDDRSFAPVCRLSEAAQQALIDSDIERLARRVALTDTWVQSDLTGNGPMIPSPRSRRRHANPGANRDDREATPQPQNGTGESQIPKQN